MTQNQPTQPTIHGTDPTIPAPEVSGNLVNQFLDILQPPAPTGQQTQSEGK